MTKFATLSDSNTNKRFHFKCKLSPN